MNIGVFFGSFNPIHKGHVAIAEHFLSQSDLDEVWLSVSPQNPWKEAHGLAPMEHRIAMVTIATQHNDSLKVTDFEKDLPQPSFTYKALNTLNKLHREHEITLLIGGDNCELFDKWRNYDKILADFRVLAYPRDASKMIPELASQMTLIKAPLLDMASTDIRQDLEKGTKPKNINQDVFDYILEHDLYQLNER